MSGNLKYMRCFAEQCPAGLMGQQVSAPWPWFYSDHTARVRLDTNLPSIEELEAQLALSEAEGEKAIEPAPAGKPSRKKGCKG